MSRSRSASNPRRARRRRLHGRVDPDVRPVDAHRDESAHLRAALAGGRPGQVHHVVLGAWAPRGGAKNTKKTVDGEEIPHQLVIRGKHPII